MLSIEKLYQILYQNMGPQYWWPAETPIEMMLGAILVQNTNWNNADIALSRLKEETSLMHDDIENAFRIVAASDTFEWFL